jgi:hypothetical protein
MLRAYVPFVRDGGKVILISPQERGYASDATHVEFFDLTALRVLTDELGLDPLRSTSFPFPRPMGRLFIYNEFVAVARTRQPTPDQGSGPR